MDTRKLLTHVTDGGAVYVADNHRFSDASIVVRIDASIGNSDPERIAAELVRRWNDYPQQAERIAKLEEALKDLFDNCVMVHKHWGDGGNSKQAKEAEDRARALLQTLKTN